MRRKAFSAINGPAPLRPIVQFRPDLKVTAGSGPDGESGYRVEDPITGESFSFGEEEYFLCKSMDGRTNAIEILERFRNRFAMGMSLESFHSFEEHLLAMGLARAPMASEEPAASLEAPVASSIAALPPAVQADEPLLRETRNPRWTVFNPKEMFGALLRFALPFMPLWRFVLWSLIPGFPVAVYALVVNWTAFVEGLQSMRFLLGYFGTMFLVLFVANFCRCILQGTVCAYYGVPPRAFGLKLRRGILIKFFISRDKVAGLPRSAKLWIYGVCLIMRLAFLVYGTFLWLILKDADSLLTIVALALAHSGIIGLILELLPLETTNGYRWLTNFFGLPTNMLFIALRVLGRRIQGQPLPVSLEGERGVRYLLYSFILVSIFAFGAYKITDGVLRAVMEIFPNVFGRATSAIFLTFIVICVGRWVYRSFFFHPSRKPDVEDDDGEFEPFEEDSFPELPTEKPTAFLQRHRIAIGLAVISLLMLLPARFQPGGEIQVLPPQQAEIQAIVPGHVTEVAYKGGDGTFIPKGTLVAKTVSYDVEDQLLSLEQKKNQQAAGLEKLKSNLAKLQSGYRTEEIDQAQSKYQQAVEQLNIALQELESAKVQEAYSEQVLPRYEKLYAIGAIAFLQFQEEKKTAGMNKINVIKQQKAVAAAEQNRDLTKSELDQVSTGYREEDIEVAAQAVKEAEAELARVVQQIQYAQQQQKQGELVMPIDGYLVTGSLDYKKGNYLKTGDNFATAQNNSQPEIEVMLPEYDMAGIEAGAKATIKLFANPGAPLHGRVLSIQPATLPTSDPRAAYGTQVFKVRIEVDKAPFPLKSGMTGYAKIQAGTQPLGLLLLRPVMRFVQIELWSWLP